MPNPETTASDIGWMVLFMMLFLFSVVAGMFIFSAYLTPVVLGSPDSVPRTGLEKLVEFALLFGGLAFGMCAALLAFCLLARRFLGSSSYERWTLQLENGADRFHPIQLSVARHVMNFIKPRGQSNAL